MSLSAYFLRHDEWERYYNCSAYTIDSVPISQRAHPVGGALLVAIGILSELAYIPCVYAMLCPRLRGTHIYNQMLYYALGEMAQIFLVSILFGWVFTTGAVYCSHPALIYWACIMQNGLWVSTIQTLILIAANRCLVIYDSSLADRFFERPVYKISWVVLPLVSAFALNWNTPPTMANSIAMASLYNPHSGYLPDNAYYSNPPGVVCFQYYSVLAIITVYAVFAVLVYRKFYAVRSRRRIVHAVVHGSSTTTEPTNIDSEQRPNRIAVASSSHSTPVMKFKRRDLAVSVIGLAAAVTTSDSIQTFAQVAVINGIYVFMVAAYMNVQLFNGAFWTVLVATYGCALFQGSTAFVYLTMNQAVRNEVKALYRRLVPAQTTSHGTTLACSERR